ncbi:MAG: amino acid ABC transporter substrate-binding protein [Comamonas sp.]|nr:amino acid ABC transporter substrate-binding protein [Comamonas sp.]
MQKQWNKHSYRVWAMVAVALGILLSGLIACGKSEHTFKSWAAKNASPAIEKIVIGLDDNFPPMGFRNEKNELIGFEVDLARAAAQRMGLQVQFKAIDWMEKEAELADKRIDMLWSGLAITEERQQSIALSTPYMYNHQIIVTTARSGVRYKADLVGKVVGTQAGSSAVDALLKEEALLLSLRTLKLFSDNVAALVALGAGRLDAVVVDEVVGLYHIAQQPLDYIVLDEHFGYHAYSVGLRKEDGALLQQLELALDAMEQDGTAARIAQQWFGAQTSKLQARHHPKHARTTEHPRPHLHTREGSVNTF